MSKPRIAFFTSSARGLAHYVVHLWGPMKKYVDPFYVTYAKKEIDPWVKDKIHDIYQLIEDETAMGIVKIKNFIEEHKIDYINVHVSDTARRLAVYYSSFLSLAKSKGIKIVMTIHDVLPYQAAYSDLNAVELLYNIGDTFIVANETEKEKLTVNFKIDSNKIFICPHPTYNLFNQKRYNTKSARKYLKIPQDKKVILFFGQVRPHKGLRYLIKAMPKIIKEFPQTLLFISTDLHSSTVQLNEYLNRIEKSGISDHIHLEKGYKPTEDIEPVFKAADVVVLPYEMVSQSGILNVAIPMARPVIVTSIFNEAKELDGKGGLVVPKRDPEAISRAVIELFKNPDKSKEMGKWAKEYFQNKFTWDDAAKINYEAIIKSKEA